MREEKILFSKGFFDFTDIRKLQDKAKTSYTLNTRRPRFGYLEAFYNTKRIHSHCDFMSPDEFERVYKRANIKAELLAG